MIFPYAWQKVRDPRAKFALDTRDMIYILGLVRQQCETSHTYEEWCGETKIESEIRSYTLSKSFLFS